MRKQASEGERCSLCPVCHYARKDDIENTREKEREGEEGEREGEEGEKEREERARDVKLLSSLLT